MPPPLVFSDKQQTIHTVSLRAAYSHQFDSHRRLHAPRHTASIHVCFSHMLPNPTNLTTHHVSIPNTINWDLFANLSTIYIWSRFGVWTSPCHCFVLFWPLFASFSLIADQCQPLALWSLTLGFLPAMSMHFSSKLLDGKNYSLCTSQVELWLIVSETHLTKKKDNFSIVDHVWRSLNLVVLYHPSHHSPMSSSCISHSQTCKAIQTHAKQPFTNTSQGLLDLWSSHDHP